MSHQLTVYVIDDDLQVRHFLANCLDALGAKAWPFAGGAEFLEVVAHLAPACILLDMEMPHRSGLYVLEELNRRGIDWPVIGLSGRDELAVAVEAMKLGATDVLKKPITEESLRLALAPAWPALQESIAINGTRREAQALVVKLTPRELDISLALLRGQANKIVAYQLGISVRTVEMHRAHVMAKLGVKNLAEAAVLVGQAGVTLCSGETAAIVRAALSSPATLSALLAPVPDYREQRQLSRSAA